MKLALSKCGYYLRLWLARQWADPQLVTLAERYGSVIVTAERHGKFVLPIFHAPYDGEATARLVADFCRMRDERDYWHQQFIKRHHGD